eukprot:1140433-Pelagomonas_calceolata.AAC.1
MNLKTATYVVKGEPYGGGPRLGQIASTWFESLAKSEVHNGELQKLLHLAEKGFISNPSQTSPQQEVSSLPQPTSFHLEVSMTFLIAIIPACLIQ